MSKKIAVLLANGFEEGEALFVVDIMRRAGFDCDLVSIKEDMVEGSHGIIVKADERIENVEKDSYDMVILPGGLPGADNLRDCKEVIKWVQIFINNSSKFVAAICAAPQVLAKAGVIKGKKVTSYPSDNYREILKDAHYIDDELVVVDGNIITSKGPATTMPFAYKLVELLGGDATSLKEGMLFNMLKKDI